MNRIDKAALKTVQAEILAATTEIAKRHGLTITAGGGTFDSFSATIKLNIRLNDTGGGITAAEAEFRQYAAVVGLKADDYGRQFERGGFRYRISGVRMSARTMPVIATRFDNNKQYRFNGDDVARLLVGPRS